MNNKKRHDKINLINIGFKNNIKYLIFKQLVVLEI